MFSIIFILNRLGAGFLLLQQPSGVVGGLPKREPKSEPIMFGFLTSVFAYIGVMGKVSAIFGSCYDG